MPELAGAGHARPRIQIAEILAAGVLALAGVVLGAMISYAKARAQSLDMTADVGLMERADRFVVILVGTFVAGFVGPWAMIAAMAILVLGSAWTVVQRMAEVHRQGRAGAQEAS